MAINMAGAQNYFGEENHVRYEVWREFSEKQKTAAIAQAKRLLQHLLGDDDLDDDATADGDFPRTDLAVYEQALWLLVNSRAVPNADENGAKFIDEARGNPAAIAPEARRWLFAEPGRVALTRG